MFGNSRPRTKAVKDKSETEREKIHKKLVCRSASERIVLLENDGVLPIKPGKLLIMALAQKRQLRVEQDLVE
ncbi:MAG: hypothetical protein U9O65_03155 [Thermotogota bacterium]|nr:hypothetical protein [Thermotogota bacterium]